MKRAAVVAILSLAVLLPGSAGAKGGPVTGEVCGASGCAVIPAAATVYQSLRWAGTFAIVAAPRPAPFYTLEFAAPGPGGFR